MAGILTLDESRMRQDVARLDFYAVLLTERCPDCCCKCGRRSDDFPFATLRCLRPGAVLDWTEGNAWPDKGFLLVFHPDLLHGTTLESHIADYTFFDYKREEALHLSCREAATVRMCADRLKAELEHAIDRHSATLLTRHIELLLDYCSRFYERQSITRDDCHEDFLRRLEAGLREDVDSGRMRQALMPTLQAYAQRLGLSAAYLADLLHYKRGQTFDEYVQSFRFQLACQLLIQTDASPSEVAHKLGFAHVQTFSKFFKRLTGIAPASYRLLGS